MARLEGVAEGDTVVVITSRGFDGRDYEQVEVAKVRKLYVELVDGRRYRVDNGRPWGRLHGGSGRSKASLLTEGVLDDLERARLYKEICAYPYRLDRLRGRWTLRRGAATTTELREVAEAFRTAEAKFAELVDRPEKNDTGG